MSKKVVFVIGAGASFDLKFPLGRNLTEKISTLLSCHANRGYLDTKKMDPVISAYCSQRPNSIQYYRAAQQISEAVALVDSIDQYIDQQREDDNIKLVAKMAIVKAILEAENKSELFHSEGEQFDINKVSSTWYRSLWSIITAHCTKSDLTERFKKISFIIFNYDRCVEQFFYLALRKAYPMDHNEAASLLSEIDFYHPYGSLGPLKWQENGSPVSFGHEPSHWEIGDLSENISTFSEHTENSQRVNALAAALPLVFLGFGYLDLNLELLTRYGKPDRNSFCLGTTYDEPATRISNIKNKLKRSLGFSSNTSLAQLSEPDVDCTRFFENHGFQIAEALKSAKAFN